MSKQIGGLTSTGKLYAFRSVSDEENQMIKSHLKTINHFYDDLDYLAIIEENFQELIQLSETELERFKKYSIGTFSEMRSYQRPFQRRLCNFMSSVKMLEDQCAGLVSQRFNDDTKVFEYKNMWSSYYDETFEFRFFQRLRNYAQHRKLPISGINLSSSIPNNHSLTLTFNKKDLLENYTGWSKVAEEIELLEDKIDIIPPLYLYMSQLRQLHTEYIWKFSKPEIYDAENCLKKLELEAKNKDVVSSFGILDIKDTSPRQDKSNINVNIEHIPLEFLKDFKQYFKISL